LARERLPHDFSLDRLAWLSDVLDTKWRIPGTQWRFGVDAVAGMVPGLGDLLSGAAGLYILAGASHHGAPRVLMARMVGNLLFDTVVGSVPIIGGIFDIAFKANQRNLRLLIDHIEQEAAQAAKPVQSL
jgi:hypothetical protein